MGIVLVLDSGGLSSRAFGTWLGVWLRLNCGHRALTAMLLFFLKGSVPVPTAKGLRVGWQFKCLQSASTELVGQAEDGTDTEPAPCEPCHLPQGLQTIHPSSILPALGAEDPHTRLCPGGLTQDADSRPLDACPLLAPRAGRRIEPSGRGP